MRRSRSALYRLLHAFALATCLALVPRAGHAAPAATVAQPAVTAPVSLTQDADAFTLANGIVTARISKETGNLVSLQYQRLETMGGGGVWEQPPRGGASRITLDPAQNGGARGEVAIKADFPDRGFGIEVRYTLERGLSGLYTYAIYTHPASYGPLHLGESRFITKLSHAFNWLSVDADRNLLECRPEDWGAGIVIHAKEQRILTTGYYKHSVEHKYSYNAIAYRTPAYGWSSTKDHVGIWFINPSTEYLDGGPEKLDLVCHLDANNDPDPVILDYWCSGHYAGGAQCQVPAGEAWTHVVGPILVYCNALSRAQSPSAADLATFAATAGNPTIPPAWTHNADALFADALAQAKVQRGRWPFDWVHDADYPHRNERGTVTGRLVLDDPQAATTLLPRLTVGLAHPDYPGGSPRADDHGIVTWPHDGNYYQFWTDGADDGRFTIRNIRPGTYTLHAFANGVLGEFARTNVTVGPGQTVELGNLDWKPVRDGRQLWEIGYPNRTGDEFFKGDGANYWLWGWGLRYALLFPHDITYTIGQSDYHRDWFFQETPHAENMAWVNPKAKDPANQRFGWMAIPPRGEDFWRVIGHGRATTWTINFTLPQPVHGRATLRVALAGSDGFGGLLVGVNGQNVGTIHTISTNALRYNTDKGVWREYALPFDAARLTPGANHLTLTVPAGELTSGVVYDYLRLELDENQPGPKGPVEIGERPVLFRNWGAWRRQRR